MKNCKIRYDENGNARCGECGRLIFKCLPNAKVIGIEIKCHSCKAINVTEARQCVGCRWRKDLNGTGFVCVCAASERLGQGVSNHDTCDSYESKFGI